MPDETAPEIDGSDQSPETQPPAGGSSSEINPISGSIPVGVEAPVENTPPTEETVSLNPETPETEHPIDKLRVNIEASSIPNSYELLQGLSEIDRMAHEGRTRFEADRAADEASMALEQEGYQKALKIVLAKTVAVIENAKNASKDGQGYENSDIDLKGPEKDTAFVLVSTPIRLAFIKEKGMAVVIDPVNQKEAYIRMPRYDQLRADVYAMMGAVPPKIEKFKFGIPEKQENAIGEWTSDPKYREAVVETPTNIAIPASESGKPITVTIVEVINKYEDAADPYVRKIGLRYRKLDSSSYDTSTAATTASAPAADTSNLPLAA